MEYGKWGSEHELTSEPFPRLSGWLIRLDRSIALSLSFPLSLSLFAHCLGRLFTSTFRGYPEPSPNTFVLEGGKQGAGN